MAFSEFTFINSIHYGDLILKKKKKKNKIT